jgi:eukaryotic-like serine/threonine-protein kinase
MSIRVGESLGDYRIVELIGAGGMGQVYRAEHMITGRYEALKAVLKESADDPDIGARFLREIRVHANLHHTNIVAVYNAFWFDQDLVLAMEFVDGEPLDRLLKLGPMPLSRAVDITCQTLKALSYAHGRGVTHRDVSPTNILLSNRGTVKLMDFGLAIQPTDLRLTQSGVPVGSLAYMAPEQVRNGADADFRSDIYSMGIVLYQMLSGKRPFVSENGFEIMKAHIEKAPPPLRQWAAHIPESVEAVVMKALEKNPDSRFASAEAFRKALHDAANPPSPAASPQRGSAHYGQSQLGLSPALLAALAVMLMGLTFVATRALMRPDTDSVSASEQMPADGSESGQTASPVDPNQMRAGPRADQMQRSAAPPGGQRTTRGPVRSEVPNPPRINSTAQQVDPRARESAAQQQE